MSTYTNRTIKVMTVSAVEAKRVTLDDGFSYYVPEGHLDKFRPGMEVIMEMMGSRTSGWLIDGAWIMHTSDEEFEAERKTFLENFEKEKRERLEANREFWKQQEDELPGWIKDRITYFRSLDESTFELDGWGYELAIARLAVAYANMGSEILDKDVFSIQDSDEVKRLSEEMGTSGNQHGMALALAKAHLRSPEETLSGTVSGLSPLTGKVGYTKD